MFDNEIRAKEQIDVLYDTHMQEVMLARKNDVGTIPLKEALIDEELDFDEIMTIADRFDENIA